MAIETRNMEDGTKNMPVRYTGPLPPSKVSPNSREWKWSQNRRAYEHLLLYISLPAFMNRHRGPRHGLVLSTVLQSAPI